MSQRPSVYQGGQNMRAQSDSPFVEGFMDGMNIRRNIMAEKEALQNQKEYEGYKNYLKNALDNYFGEGDYTRGQIPDAPYPITQNTMGDNPIGDTQGNVLFRGLNNQQSAPQTTQQPQTIAQGRESSPTSWDSLFGNDKTNFQNPSSDNLTVPTEEAVDYGTDITKFPSSISDYLGQKRIAPKQIDENYNLQKFMQDEIKRGTPNPFLSLSIYQNFLKPIVEQARQDRLKQAYIDYNNPNATIEQRNSALATLEYELKRPGLSDDLDWQNERRQMQRENHRANLNNLLSSSSGFVDRVRDLKGRIGYNAPDGTNCMRTMGLALSGTPYEGQINVDQAISTAKEIGDLHAFGDGYRPRAGDMAVVNGGKHVVMLTENGGTIQNGESHNGVYEDKRSPEQIFGKVDYWISSSRYAGGINRRQTGGRSRITSTEQFNKQLQKLQENFNKNTEGARQNAINLANLGNIKEDDEKGKENYEKTMNNFIENVKGLCDVYGRDNSQMDSTQFGIALYHKLNEDPTGLKPEQLAEAVAKAVAVKRGGVSAEKLYNDILDEVYKKNKTQKQKNLGNENPTPSSGALPPKNPPNKKILNYDPDDNPIADRVDARRRLTEHARNEGLEFSPYTGELQVVGSSLFDNYFGDPQEMKQRAEKIRDFKRRYSLP